MNADAISLDQGIALMNSGRFAEAIQAFGAAMQRQPLAWEPRVGISQSFQGLGDHWAGAAWLADACRVAPQREALWLELAGLLTRHERHAELEPLLTAAVGAMPASVALLQMQGEMYLRHKDHAKAGAAYQRLYDLRPEDPGVLLNFGFCMEQAGALEKAVALYRKAALRKPDFFEAHVDLAGVLWRVQDFDGAMAHARKAVELAPQHPFAVRIMGTGHFNLNQLQDAETWLRKALALQPGLTLAEIDLAFTLLLAGRLREGWQMYHLRWRDTDRMKRPAFFRADAEWKGRALQPLAGKRIAVYAEQGLGDVIQFIRYVDHLRADGATVICVIHDELVSLVQHSMPGVQCPARGELVEADHHVALLDLPMHYDTTLENVPARIPYLGARQDKIDEWAQRMPPAEGRLRVGLAWAGSPAQVNNGNRSMRLSELMPLVSMPQLQCFSLQKEKAGVFTDVVPDASRLTDLTPALGDFADTAAMIHHLDIVVTVDTSIAHLAGAMGKTVWVMLPPNPDWRYLLDREDSPWYPTMRLFRRGFGERRAAQVERVRVALERSTA